MNFRGVILRKSLITLLFIFTALPLFAQPEPTREFRGIWIATVDNIDFPSKKGMTIAEQKTQILADLDLVRSLHFNAVIFQVRPQCDALYSSKIEPWSEFLTGEMGKPQGFDPLDFLIREAHRRGILVHAWFNPYRALHPAAKTVSENHISKRRPDLVRKYGKYLWLDPSDAEVQNYSLSVVMDVVKRYDIDGVHFDDYFYPYPEKDSAGNNIEFPDDANWERYQNAGGGLSRGDWRRGNVNDFIVAVGRGIKAVKPQVMYGISPFGIWQPQPQLGISGFNQYELLFADARKWIHDGTVDYLAPQLYWETARKGQSFPVLLKWWSEQNASGRHLWPGLGTYRVGTNENFTAGEIFNQIRLTRDIPNGKGTIQFSFKSVKNNLGGIQSSLTDGVFSSNALVPVTPWIKSLAPSKPRARATKKGNLIEVRWSVVDKAAFWIVVQVLDETGWSQSVLPVSENGLALSSSRRIQRIVIRSSNRLGGLSESFSMSIPQT